MLHDAHTQSNPTVNGTGPQPRESFDRASTSSHASENLVVALELTSAGIPIFPARIHCNQQTSRWNKIPCIKNWQTHATTDAYQIREWWVKFPDAVPGIELAGANLIVADADRHGGPDGVAALTLLAAEHGGMPPGPVTLTPGNGEHYFFRQPDGERLGNRSGMLPDGIDVRGAGGWIVAPGAIRPDGRRWEPAPGAPSLANSYRNGTIPPLAEWLAALIRTRRHASSSSFSNSSGFSRGAEKSSSSHSREAAYAAAALSASVADLSRAPRGSRNEALNGSAYRLARMIGRGWVEQSDVADALRRACEANGLVQEDGADAVQRTLGSAFKAGLKNPHDDLTDRHYEDVHQKSAGAHSRNPPKPPGDEPLPLMRTLPPAEPFPIDSLGPVMGAAARAYEAATQAPMDICANAALAVAALAAQAHADVRLPTGEDKPLSLFLFSIAGTGERKTSTDRHAQVAVKEREAELRTRYEAEIVEYLNTKANWDAERKKILGDRKAEFDARKVKLDHLGPEPKTPLTPVLVCHEPTFEGLAKLLNDGQPSVGVFASEGGVFIGGHGFNDEAKLRTAAGLSMMWDDGSLTRVRGGDGVMVLSGRRVSLHLQAQPSVAARLFSDPLLADQGLLSRILVVAPETRRGQRFWRDVSPEHKRAMQTYVARAQELLRRSMPIKEGTRNELAPRVLRLTPEARQVWIAFSDDVERLLAPGSELEPISGLAAKLPEHAARIAGVLTLFEDPDATEIGAAVMKKAMELSYHYARTALRLHGASAFNSELLDAERLLSWLKTKWKHALISLPDIVQLGPNSTRDTTTANRLIAILEKHRHLEPLGGPAKVNGKQRRDVWRIVGATHA